MRVTKEDEAATEFTGLGEELEGGREIHEEAKKLVVQGKNRVSNSNSNQQTKTRQSVHQHLHQGLAKRLILTVQPNLSVKAQEIRIRIAIQYPQCNNPTTQKQSGLEWRKKQRG